MNGKTKDTIRNYTIWIIILLVVLGIPSVYFLWLKPEIKEKGSFKEVFTSLIGTNNDSFKRENEASILDFKNSSASSIEKTLSQKKNATLSVPQGDPLEKLDQIKRLTLEIYQVYALKTDDMNSLEELRTAIALVESFCSRYRYDDKKEDMIRGIIKYSSTMQKEFEEHSRLPAYQLTQKERKDLLALISELQPLAQQY